LIVGFLDTERAGGVGGPRGFQRKAALAQHGLPGGPAFLRSSQRGFAPGRELTTLARASPG
jgi:hypothetical protein